MFHPKPARGRRWRIKHSLGAGSRIITPRHDLSPLYDHLIVGAQIFLVNFDHVGIRCRLSYESADHIQEAERIIVPQVQGVRNYLGRVKPGDATAEFCAPGDIV
jgi:hypothetical protein